MKFSWIHHHHHTTTNHKDATTTTTTGTTTTTTTTTTTKLPITPTTPSRSSDVTSYQHHHVLSLSPTTKSLGSGHYSPRDGTVQTFTPNKSISGTSLNIQVLPESLCDHDHYDSIVTSSLSLLKIIESTLTDETSDTITAIDDDILGIKEEDYTTMTDTTTTTTTTTTTDITIPTNSRIVESSSLSNYVNHTTMVAATTVLPSQEDECAIQPPPQSSSSSNAIVFMRHTSSFLRVSDLTCMDHDLDMSEHDTTTPTTTTTITTNNTNTTTTTTTSIPNYHKSSHDPPPGMKHDPIEKWVVLDNGTTNTNNTNSMDDISSTSTTTASTSSSVGSSTVNIAPIAPTAINALANMAISTLFDTSMWIPESKTMKLLQSTKSKSSWEHNTFQQQQQNPCDDEYIYNDHILVWSGSFTHGCYGSDIPAIRSAAIIHMSPKQLVDLLIDSNRVKEYNTMSLGRIDLLTFPTSTTTTSNDVYNHHTNNHNNHHHYHIPNSIVTKIMRSESRPPLLRKILQFTSIFHARELENDDGYLLVTRAVEHHHHHHHTNTKDTSGVIVAEILLGVNVIRKVSAHSPNQCLLLSVNHIRTPMVPLFIGKKLGLQAATNFITDLRKCC